MHTKPLHSLGDGRLQTGSHVTADEAFSLHCGFNHEDFEMFRRITVLIPLLLTLTLSGCLIFPGDGGWHHHRHYDGGHGYYQRR
jgi:predicted glycosyltransferase involved in capsule biosynthesis